MCIRDRVDTAAELVGSVHLDLFAVGAVEQGVHRLGAHILDGRVQRKAVFFTQTKVCLLYTSLDELADLTAFRLHAEKVLGELYGNAQAYQL